MSFMPGLQVVFRYREAVANGHIRVDVVVVDFEGNDLVLIATDAAMSPGEEIRTGPVYVDIGEE